MLRRSLNSLETSSYLKKYIEHCKTRVAAFIMGFADSKGCVEKWVAYEPQTPTLSYSYISESFLGDLA
jgi:hypothetical protein